MDFSVCLHLIVNTWPMSWPTMSTACSSKRSSLHDTSSARYILKESCLSVYGNFLRLYVDPELVLGVGFEVRYVYSRTGPIPVRYRLRSGLNV